MWHRSRSDSQDRSTRWRLPENDPNVTAGSFKTSDQTPAAQGLLESKIGAYNVNQRRERLVGLCLLECMQSAFSLNKRLLIV